MKDTIVTPVANETPDQAYRRARMETLKRHTYTATVKDPPGRGFCTNCGETYEDIGAHCEERAEIAGRAARNKRVEELAAAHEARELEEAKRKAQEMRP